MHTQLNNNTNKHNSNNGGNDKNTSGDNKLPFWRQLHCWNHGAKNQQGNNFRSMAEFHKYTPGFDNHLNESDHNCHNCKREKNA